jgi:hypothetical protein
MDLIPFQSNFFPPNFSFVFWKIGQRNLAGKNNSLKE